MTRGALGAALLAGVLGVAAPARAFELFRSANGDVERGNAALAEGRAAAALEAYDRAARALPGEPGVQLNRGLALLHENQLDRAREAFLAASEPPADAAMRGRAFYNLGLAFFRQAEAAASGEDHREAARLFREAVDAFRRSLRAAPGNRDAGWNLELALARSRDEEARGREAEDEPRDDAEEPPPPGADGGAPDAAPEASGGPDGGADPRGDGGDERRPDAGHGGGDPDAGARDLDGERDAGAGQDEDAGGAGEPPPGARDAGGGDAGSQGAEPATPGGPSPTLPANVEQVLDALQAGEESLERHRARARAARERRRPTKDW